MRLFLKLVGMLTILAATAVPSLAQTTGGVIGNVTDASGAVVVGATVTLVGPSLQGVLTATTDEAGNYRFRNVPPGPGYTVAVERSGFEPAIQQGIRVFLGQEGTVNLTLAPAGVTETVTVTGGSPLVDVAQTSIGVNIIASQFASLPAMRSFQQLTTLAPSVTLEMGDHDSRFEASPTVGASSAPENNYIIDGLSATDPRYGTSGTNLTMNFVEEVQVLTGGYQAEYGRSTGGVFNVITKSGGNTLRGDLFGYTQNKAWTPDGVVRRQNKELVTTSDRNTSADFGAAIGGPIVRDKVWFFGAIDPNIRTTYIGGQLEGGQAVSSVSRQYDRTANVYAGKVTWTVRPSNTLVFTTFGDPTERDGWLTNPNADDAAGLRLEQTGSHNWSVRYTSVLTPSWVLETSVGRHWQRNNLEPATEAGRSLPRQVDEVVGGYQHGGFQRVQKDTAIRDAYALKLTNVFGSHELRYGFDVERNNYNADLQETWYRFFGQAPSSWGFGDATYIQERNYAVQGEGTTMNAAFFVQDSWAIRAGLRLNVGLRFERQRLDSANNVAIAGASDAEACTVDGECRTTNGLSLEGSFAPRIGLTWDPRRDGRMKVYGFWGRFYEAVPLNINIRAINGESYIITQWVNDEVLTSDNWYNNGGSPLANNGPWSVRRVSELTAVTPLDEELKTQFEDQFVLGGDYQFRPSWSIGVRYVHRSLKRIIEDIGTFTNPEDPLELTGYVIGNPGEGFFGGPFDKPTRKYDAVEVSLQRRLQDRWQLYSSMVFARAKGNHEGLYMSGYDQLDPNITALYDIPSFIPNADGKLRADKPFQMKVHSSYTFDFGLTVSEGLQISSGVPISAQGPEIVNGYGDGTIFLKQRGSDGRTPTFWNFDLHADYRLDIGSNERRSVSFVLDVFNVFNRHATLEVDQDYVFEGMDGFDPWAADDNLDAYGNPKFNQSLPKSPFYKTPILFQAPRTVQIGIRIGF